MDSLNSDSGNTTPVNKIKQAKTNKAPAKARARMKPPFGYYGGKQMMLRRILPNIPEHEVYTEAFCGGAAVYFAKEPARVEVINDLNSNLVTFYRVAKTEFYKLKAQVATTLHSREQHAEAWAIYQNPEDQGAINVAWAVIVLCGQGFANKIGSSWGYDKSRNESPKKWNGIKGRLTEALMERLENTQVEHNDAVKVIKSRDREASFHFVDPPYLGSNCGHYEGYTEEDFRRLLDQLAACKGKFLLTSYPHPLLDEYVARHGWQQQRYTMKVAVSHTVKKEKVEVMTANYPLLRVE